MTADDKFVYCYCFCAPKPNAPKAFTGIYYARRGTTGIWYWIRSLHRAHRFELASKDACDCGDALGNVSEDCLVGFVRG